MRLFRTCLPIAAALTAFVIAAPAEDASSDAAQQKKNWTVGSLDAPLSQQLGLPAWMKLGGQYRGRMENDSAPSFVPGASDTYYLERFRLDLTIRPRPWLRFKAQLEDSRNLFYGSRALPANTRDPIDLHEAWAMVGNPDGEGFSLKVGRQEIILGDKRMVTNGEWTNVGRAFDSVRATYSGGAGFAMDLIAGSPILYDANRFDRHIPGEHFYAAYTKFGKLIPFASVEPYYFVRTQLNVKGERGDVGSSTLSSAGLRVVGTGPGRVDYNLDLVRQFGSYSRDRVSAMAGTYTLGWRVTSAPWKPRVSVEFNHASGDTAQKDGRRQTFDMLYSGHGFYGFADQLGWRNVRNARVGFDFSITKRLQLRADFNEDYLATLQDGLYSVSGTLKVINRAATSKHIGCEPDILATYQLSKGTSFQAGYSHIFAGDYLKQSTKGSGYSSPFVMWTKNF